MKKIFVVTFILLLVSNLFGHNYVPFKWNGKYGLLDSKLKLVQKAEHPGYQDSEQMIVLSGYEWDAVNLIIFAENKKYTFSSEYNAIPCTKSYVILDNYPGVRGKVLYDLKKDKVLLNESRMNPSGQVLFSATGDEGSYYVDVNGKRLFGNKDWIRAYGFYNDRAVVEVKNFDAPFQFINKSGEYVKKTSFDFLQNKFSDGLIAGINENGEKGYFDIEGKLVIPLNLYYTDGTVSASSFVNGIAFVSTKKNSNLWYCIDSEGNILSKEIYSSYIPEVSENQLTCICYEKKGKRKFAYIRSDGSKLVDLDFDVLKPFSNGYAIFQYGNYEGLVSTDGKMYLSMDLVKGKKICISADEIR